MLPLQVSCLAGYTGLFFAGVLRGGCALGKCIMSSTLLRTSWVGCTLAVMLPRSAKRTINRKRTFFR